MRGINSRLISLKNDILEVRNLLQVSEYMEDSDRKKNINKCCEALLNLSIEIDSIKTCTDEQSRDLQKIMDMLIK